MSQLQVRRTWHKLRQAIIGPLLREDSLLRVLQRLSSETPRIVMVHSSLSSCGYVCGGPLAVIRALRRWNPSATLAMPAHSYCYAGVDGCIPVFDACRTPSRVGAISDTFWRMPGVKRSLHPTHSLACDGPDSQWIVSGHETCDTPCGAGTPYEKLVSADAAVLMLGVSLDSYTLMHTAEDAAAVDYLYEAEPCSLRMNCGGSNAVDYIMRRQNMRIERRFAAMDVWFESRSLLCRTPLGRGELLWIPHCSKVHAELTGALLGDPLLLVADDVRQDG